MTVRRNPVDDKLKSVTMVLKWMYAIKSEIEKYYTQLYFISK